MLETDEDALVCDLAETYGIYDYSSLPLSRVATFAVGLRENSRIKLKMQNAKYPLETMLLASVADRLSTLVWMQSKDGMNGQNRPKSIVAQMLCIKESNDKDFEVFDTPEAFEKRRNEILRKGEGAWRVQN